MIGNPIYVFALGLDWVVFLLSALLGTLYLILDIKSRKTKIFGTHFLDNIPLVLMILQGVGVTWYLHKHNGCMVLTIVSVCTGCCIAFGVVRLILKRNRR